MKIMYRLSNDQLIQLNKLFVPHKQKGKPPNKEEKVNWIDIMGINRDTYKRVNGAVRRR